MNKSTSGALEVLRGAGMRVSNDRGIKQVPVPKRSDARRVLESLPRDETREFSMVVTAFDNGAVKVVMDGVPNDLNGNIRARHVLMEALALVEREIDAQVPF